MTQQLNEQRFVTDFISKIFNAIIRDRNQALTRTMEKDPEFQKIIADVEKSKNELHDWIEKRVKKDPELAKKLKMVRSL
jgi:hypothetical protein